MNQPVIVVLAIIVSLRLLLLHPLMELLEGGVREVATVRPEAHQEFLVNQEAMVMLKGQEMRMKAVLYALGVITVKELDWCLHREYVMLGTIAPQGRW